MTRRKLRLGFNICDNLHKVRPLMETYNEYILKMYIAVIDYGKTFEMRERQYLYRPNTNIHFWWNRWYTNISRGEIKRRHLSQTFYCCIRTNILKNELNINGEYMSHLRFPDDLVFLSNNANKLQNTITELNNTKIKLVINTQEILNIILEGNTRKTVYS